MDRAWRGVLLGVLEETDWISEDPDLHLGLRLRAVCQDPNSPWSLKETAIHEGIYIISLK